MAPVSFQFVKRRTRPSLQDYRRRFPTGQCSIYVLSHSSKESMRNGNVPFSMNTRKIVLVTMASALTASAVIAGTSEAEIRDVDTTRSMSPTVEFAIHQHRRTSALVQHVPKPKTGLTDRLKPDEVISAATLRARSKVIGQISIAEVKHGLPPGLLDALIWTESGYRPEAVSSAGAAGLAQLMPETARDLAIMDRFDVASSIDGGARYLRNMLDKFRSDPTCPSRI